MPALFHHLNLMLVFPTQPGDFAVAAIYSTRMLSYGGIFLPMGLCSLIHINVTLLFAARQMQPGSCEIAVVGKA